MGKNRRAGSKIFVFISVAILGDLSPKKQILEFFGKTLRAFFRPISGLLKS
jgi:hypothetical protein